MSANNTKWMIIIVIAAIAGAFLGPALLGGLPTGIGLAVAALFLIAVGGYLVYILAGNKVGRAAPPAVVEDARSFAPAPGMARLYVVRRGFMGGMAGMRVMVADKAGQVRMNQSLMAELPPGDYTLETAMARNGLKSSHAATPITLAAGEVSVIRATLEMRATHAMTQHQPLSPDEGRAEVLATKMVLWTEGAPAMRPATIASARG